jgi:septum formation protein
MVSGVSEDDVTGSPTEVAAILAARKAHAVAERIQQAGNPAEPDPAARRTLVLGCDSVLDLDGHAWGKPRDADDAVERWRALRGRTGNLVTGHCLLDPATRQEEAGVAGTLVHFGSPTDVEIAAYVASGEPVRVAGAFTLDGLGGWFLEGIEGDPSNVIGVSLPLVRRLIGRFGVAVSDLWPS